MIRFTRSAADGVSPLITAAAAADSDFWWQGPGGTFVGKQPNIGNFGVGDFTLRAKTWAHVTALNFSGRKLAALNLRRALGLGIPSFAANSNTNWHPSLGFVLPQWVTFFDLASGGPVGDVSAMLAAMPPAMTYFNLNACSALTGDAGLSVIPTTLSYFGLASTAITGDVSAIALVANLASLRLFSMATSYGTGGMFASATLNGASYLVNDCGWSLAEVDRVLADCVTSGTTGATLNVAGTNASPTDGVNNANRLELVNNRSWTVTVTV